MKFFVFLLFVSLAFPFIDTLPAAELPAPRQVANLNTTLNWRSSNPSYLTERNGRVVFLAFEHPLSGGYWQTDGTANGTTRIESSTNAAFDWNPFNWVPCGQNWIFSSDRFDEEEGWICTLWLTDGTPAGTRQLEPDGLPPLEHVSIFHANGLAYFSIKRGIRSSSVWRSDGTREGTFPILENTGLGAAGMVWDFVPVGEDVYFTPDERKLYRTRGTPETTELVLDLGQSSYRYLDLQQGRGSFGDNLYFFQWTFSGGTLCKLSRGSREAVEIAAVHLDGTMPAILGSFGGAVFFKDAKDEREVHVTRVDGTDDRLTVVKSFHSDTMPGVSMVGVNQKFMFMEADGLGMHAELWASDGTKAGTTLLVKSGMGKTPSYFQDSAIVGDKLWFTGPGKKVPGLWCSDGTRKGTRMVKSFDKYPTGGVVEVEAAGDLCIFSADDGIHGREIWRSDGTRKGTWMLMDIATGEGDGVFNGDDVAVLGDRYFFTGSTRYGELAAWSTDGTAKGTKHHGKPKSFFSDWKLGSYTPAGTRMLLRSGGLQAKLWSAATDKKSLRREKSLDGAVAPVSTINLGDKEMVVSGGMLYLLRWGHRGGHLHLASGLARAPGPVEGAPVATPRPTMVAADGVGYFSGHDENGVPSLWRSDGTVAGTRVVKSFLSDRHAAAPLDLLMLDGLLYFLRWEQGLCSLWKSDGTEAGTTEVHTFGFRLPDFIRMSRLGGKLVIFDHPEQRGMKVLVTDGKSAPLEIAAMERRFRVEADEFVVAGDLLYFSVEPELCELWRTDGTAEGTFPIRRHEGLLYDVSNLCAAGSYLYFKANAGELGMELWRTDGTLAGTLMLPDQDPAAPFDPRGLRFANGKLFFNADSREGRELWVLDEAGKP